MRILDLVVQAHGTITFHIAAWYKG